MIVVDYVTKKLDVILLRLMQTLKCASSLVRVPQSMRVKLNSSQVKRTATNQVQWCAIEMQHLLHKPYVNEVSLNPVFKILLDL